MALVTLKKRAEFLRLRGGARCATPAFVLETRARAADLALPAGPRFGFTVTKKIGGAVERNRIRRRLKAAVELVQEHKARPDHDYVLIAREASLERPFEDLRRDLERALKQVHQPGGASGRSGKAPR